MKLNNETKVGILATMALALLVVGYLFLKGQRIFSEGFTLKSYYGNTNGLTKGNPVLYSGVRVGEVKDIHIDPVSGEIEVRFSMDEKIRLPVDSKAIISSADLLGSKAIVIDRGLSEQLVESGATLTGEIEESLEEKIRTEILPLKDQVESLISQMDRFMGWLNETMDESNGNKIDQILDDFQAMSHQFSRISYKADTMMGSMRSAMAGIDRTVKDLQGSTVRIDGIMANTEKFTDSLAAASSSVRGIVTETEAAVAGVRSFMDTLNQGDGTLSMLLRDKEMYHSLNSSVQSIDSLVQKIKADPTIYVEFHPTLRSTDKIRKDKEKEEAKKAEKQRKQDERDERKGDKPEGE